MSDTLNFGTKLQELEAITEWFESEHVDLNEALKRFERGMELADELKKELRAVENRVEVIKQKFDAPASGPSPATDEPIALEETPAPLAGDPQLFE